MANKKFVLGMLAMMLILGLVVLGCEYGGSDGGNLAQSVVALQGGKLLYLVIGIFGCLFGVQIGMYLVAFSVKEKRLFPKIIFLLSCITRNYLAMFLIASIFSFLDKRGELEMFLDFIQNSAIIVFVTIIPTFIISVMVIRFTKRYLDLNDILEFYRIQRVNIDYWFPSISEESKNALLSRLSKWILFNRVFVGKKHN